MAPTALGLILRYVVVFLAIMTFFNVSGLTELNYSAPYSPPPVNVCLIDVNATGFLSLDGVGSNPCFPTHGARFTPFLNFFSEPMYSGRNSSLPTPNLVSQTLFYAREPVLNSNLSVFVSYLADFIASDLIKVPSEGTYEYLPTPLCDVQYDPYCYGTGYTLIKRLRSAGSLGNQFAIPNLVTHFLDLSPIYEYNDNSSLSRRIGAGGLLRDDDAGYLAKDMLNMNAVATRTFNSLGTRIIFKLFLREHNRIARLLARSRPTWDDNRLFYESRRICIAEYQKIVFEDWLPLIIGKNLRRYTGYSSGIDPSVNLVFMSAAMRFGHSTMPSMQVCLQSDGTQTPYSPISLSEGFLQPQLLNSVQGIQESLLRGMAVQQMATVGTTVSRELSRLAVQYRLDLPASDIARGRAAGLPPYNALRQFYQLNPVQNVSDLAPHDPATQNMLSALYVDPVGQVDPYVAGLLEKPVTNGTVGAFFAACIGWQFLALRDGDRYYYKSNNSGFSPAAIALLDTVNISQLVVLNFNISNYPANSFIAVTDINKWSSAFA